MNGKVNVNEVSIKVIWGGKEKLMPVEDYLDYKSCWYGFNDYEDLRKDGGCISLSDLVFEDGTPLTEDQTEYVQNYFDGRLKEEVDKFAQFMNLKNDDLVVYANGDVRIVKESNEYEDELKGFAIFNNKGHCLVYLGVDNKLVKLSSAVRNEVSKIAMIVSKDDSNYDDYLQAFHNESKCNIDETRLDENEQGEER